MNALVLGGGGPVGASWTAALLDGLGAAGLPLGESDAVVGTSAGAVVGAWLTIQPDGLPELPKRMRARATWHADNARSGRGDKSLLQRMAAGSGRDSDSARSIAQSAIAAIPPVSADEAEALWKAALPDGAWPRQLRAVAVNADTGLAHAWSAQDGISLAVAVSCSTAAPGAAPPVAVADSVWVDGGVRSGTNADLLIDFDGHESGPDKVLIVAPMPSDDLAREQAILHERGYRVRVVTAAPFYTAPTDLLDPHFVDVAATAGASQARDIAADLRTWWSD
ncbi:patatin-like phospholipase family protein [Saccharopolyspora sp. K220]|uniref:patatin-like phospholipase family protein n=1 Tax=Saccharopolyspora soli TaxID=2926618 RepID=UPI001F5AFF2F|nr:patatin-like phospholipase family protein [Saccharopolyspora soli]MCI2422117.1 patatin-like phospholipase family protein [Saccharopolyspora soli]